MTVNTKEPIITFTSGIQNMNAMFVCHEDNTPCWRQKYTSQRRRKFMKLQSFIW